MPSPRWSKLGHDVWLARGRVLTMIAAITISLVGVGAILGAYSVLSREITRSYFGTRPASATLEMSGGVDREFVARVRRHPLVSEAEARDVILARAKVDDDWRRLLLFVIDDFSALRLNRFEGESGAWPPPVGTMLLERSAVPVMGKSPGDALLVKPPHGPARELDISGVVHDSGLAPAWQEGSGYAYVTRETLAALGEPALLGELRIELASGSTDPRVVEAEATAVARWVTEQGRPVRAIQVPPPAQHPHQRQMTTVLLMMLCFAGMALVLSAILVANSLAAMLARQVREIGVMKAVGARASQIAGLYVVLVGVLGLVSVVLALPLGVLGARLFSSTIAHMLNFTLVSQSIPGWVFAVQLAAGILVPLATAAVPIGRASLGSVRQALDDHGASTERLRASLSFLPQAMRNAARRPARLALTLGLLAAGGAMFMTAFNMKEGWSANVAKVYETRSYDVEVRLQEAQPLALAERLRRLPEVARVEAWGLSRAAFARPNATEVMHTYPDQGHGSLFVMAPPEETTLVHFPLKAGRWLAPGDRDAAVLNHVALAQVPGAKVGDSVELSLDGRRASFQVVGVVEEVGSPALVYVSEAAFAQATGSAGRARMLRVASRASTPSGRAQAIRAVERELFAANVGVESAVPLAELRTAIGDHILVLIRALIAMAVILGVVGTLGLGSAMGISVVERTREIAVMRTLGATPRHIVRSLLSEGVAIGATSFGLAWLASIPLTALVGAIIGNLGFLAPLPLVIAHGPVLIWLGLVVSISYATTLVPARRAATRVVHEALARI